MTHTSESIVALARLLVRERVPYAEQGRMTLQPDGRLTGPGTDCGGLLIFIGQTAGISTFDLLGYDTRPVNGEFERVMNEHTIRLASVDDARVGDILGFDYGAGLNHVGLVSQIDERRSDPSRRYKLIHARRDHGVSDTLLGFEYAKFLTVAYRLPCLA